MNTDPTGHTPSEEEKLKGSPLQGGLIAFLSSLCCTVPLIAVIFGFGGVPFLLRLTKFRPFFIALSLVVMAGALWWTWRRNRGCCVTREQKKRLNRTLTMMTGVYVVTFLGLAYGVPALLAQAQTPAVAQNGVGAPGGAAGEVATKRIDVKVEGLTCSACPASIRSLLTAEAGIQDARVSYPEGTGYVLFDDSITKEQVVAKFTDAGYEVEITGESKLAN